MFMVYPQYTNKINLYFPLSNVLATLALDVARHRLDSDLSLSHRTALSVDEILHL